METPVKKEKISLEDWLERANLESIKEVLHNSGVHTLESLSRINEEAIEELRINKKIKKKLILAVKKLQMEKEKRKKKKLSKVLDLLESCQKKNNSIVSVWRTKVEKASEVKDFLFTSSIVTEILERIRHNMVKQGEDCDIDLFTLIKQLASSLDQYNILLTNLQKHKKLQRALHIAHRRNKIEQIDSLVYNDTKILLEASGISPIHQQIKKASLSRIDHKDGREMWGKQFSTSDMNLVPWPIFMKGFRKHLGKKIKLTIDDEILLKHALDNANSGFVTPSRFSAFLSLFGPIQECIKNLRDMYSQKWFGNFLSFEEVIRLLSTQTVGTFLVRFSLSRRDSFALEYVENEGKIRTVLIEVNETGLFITEDGDIKRQFKSIQEIIFYYDDILHKPYHSDFFNQRWFYADVDMEEARELLQGRPAGTYLLHFQGKVKLNGIFVCSYSLKNNKVRQIFLQKVRSGYVQRFKRGSSDDILELHQHKSKKRNRSLSTDTPKLIDEERVYHSIAAFIDSHRDILRYNYDQEGVPLLRFVTHEHIEKVVEIFGPESMSEGTLSEYTNRICGMTLSTYPAQSVGAQVLCDVYRVKVVGNRTIFVIADGCNWGQRSRDAAQKASASFINTMSCAQSLHDSNEVKHYLLRSFSKAHDAVVEGHDDIWSAGTTTLLGGMIIPLEDFKEENEYALLCASVGDCKVYHWNRRQNVVSDLTYGNRRNVRDPKDCGGRIGPYLDGGMPDLRNLKCYFYPCRQGDIIIAASDGIHDNLDPEYLGLYPNECGLNYDNWGEIPYAEMEKAKSEYALSKLKEIINGTPEITVSKISDALIKRCQNITENSRTFMEQNPQLPEPKNYKEYPGKMDHTTCITLLVGPYWDAGNDKSKEKKDKKAKDDGVRKVKSMQSVGNGHATNLTRFKSETIHPNSSLLAKARLEKYFPHDKITNILNNYPKFELRNVSLEDLTSTVISDYSEKEQKINSSASAWTVSTYPQVANVGRLGEPIVDFYSLQMSDKRTTFALTRGCNWGKSSKESAENSNKAWMKHVLESHILTDNTQKLSSHLIEAIAEAQSAIVDGKKNFLEASTSTLLAGVLCEVSGLECDSTDNWFISCVSVGDSKLFLWNTITSKLVDLTRKNEAKDFEDPDCKLGPATTNGEPDLKDLMIISRRCQENDILLVVSPAVYANFDPVVLGKTPSDFGLQHKSWSDVPQLSKVRRKYRHEHMEKFLATTETTPHNFTKALIEYNIKITTKSREFMESSVNAKLPEDYVTYPGKLGHITVIAFTVGKIKRQESSRHLLHIKTIFKPMPKNIKKKEPLAKQN